MAEREGGTWGGIVNALIESIKEVLHSIANFVKENARAVAEVVIGVGLAYGVYRLVARMFPQIRTVFGLFG